MKKAMTDLFAIEPLKFVVPIAPSIWRRAEQFRQAHSQPDIAERVYLNSLAVFAAQYYLDCMGFETDLNASDSCNLVGQALMDTADLQINPLGKLECRPVQLGDRQCLIPPEVQQNRVGYLVVQLDLESREATLLGFCQTATHGKLVLDDLQPLDMLLAHLHQVAAQRSAPVSTASTLTIPILTAHLSQWLQGTFEAGWQRVEALLPPATVSLAFRGAPMTAIQGARPIHLSVPGVDCRVDGIFVVVLHPENRQHLRLQLQIHAANEFLSPGLTLTVIDETGATFVRISAGTSDRLIQTPQFQGRSGERFRAVITLNQDSVAIDFVI
jgi:hypothetical protein